MPEVDDEYRFRGWCDICKRAGPWEEAAESAREWADDHFADDHPSNPMAERNTRVQRFPAEEVEQ